MLREITRPFFLHNSIFFIKVVNHKATVLRLEQFLGIPDKSGFVSFSKSLLPCFICLESRDTK